MQKRGILDKKSRCQPASANKIGGARKRRHAGERKLLSQQQLTEGLRRPHPSANNPKPAAGRTSAPPPRPVPRGSAPRRTRGAQHTNNGACATLQRRARLVVSSCTSHLNRGKRRVQTRQASRRQLIGTRASSEAEMSLNPPSPTDKSMCPKEGRYAEKTFICRCQRYCPLVQRRGRHDEKNRYPSASANKIGGAGKRRHAGEKKLLSRQQLTGSRADPTPSQASRRNKAGLPRPIRLRFAESAPKPSGAAPRRTPQAGYRSSG